MTVRVNIDGHIGTGEEATVSVFDRGFLYGDSIYEVIRTYDSRPFAVHEHLQRLERSAGRLDIRLPDSAWMVDQLFATLEAAHNSESLARLIVTRGSGPLTLDPTRAADPLFVLLVSELVAYPSWMYEQGIQLLVATVRRNSREAMDPAIKSGNYLNSILALGEAKRAGYDDAVLLNASGDVAEATSANVFAMMAGELVTPPLETGLLGGVTRNAVIELARGQGLPVKERSLTVAELQQADEVMLTSTIREVLPVKVVGDKTLAGPVPGPVAVKLRQLLQHYARQHTKTHTPKTPATS